MGTSANPAYDHVAQAAKTMLNNAEQKLAEAGVDPSTTEGIDLAERVMANTYQSITALTPNAVLALTAELRITNQLILASLLGDRDPAKAGIVKHYAKAFTR